MPLIKSSSKDAFKANVGTLMSEVGKSPHVQTRAQALAIAYATKRRARADGGGVHVGSIASEVPGRTDDHPMDVAAGSYVIPSEAVSNLGENNTAAGLAKLNEVLSGTPEQIRRFFGVKLSLNFARGGAAPIGVEQPVPINAAGGEFVMPPEAVAVVGSGDLTRGHKLLDAWVMNRRKSHIRTLQRLPRPAKD
jgi:hypothetical protein